MNPFIKIKHYCTGKQVSIQVPESIKDYKGFILCPFVSTILAPIVYTIIRIKHLAKGICRKGKGDNIEMRLKDFLGSEKKSGAEISRDRLEEAPPVAERFNPDEKDMKSKMNLQVSITLSDDSQIGRSALLLASTTGPGEEKRLKDQIVDFGWKAVATEVGGLAGELPQKITRAVVGAALNGEIVRKTSSEMHGLMHAAFEAMNGFMSIGMLEASIGVKIGIVRNRTWIAVAVVGDTAYHAVAHHERCGLGVMHI